MRKQQLSMHVVFYEDSRTYAMHVVQHGADGTSELLSVVESSYLSDAWDAWALCREWLQQRMAEPLSSSPRSSDVG